MMTKRELLWSIIVNAESYLLHDSWSLGDAHNYQEWRDKHQKPQEERASSYSFLTTFANETSESTTLTFPAPDTLTTRTPSTLKSVVMDDDWQKLNADVVQLHFYPLPSYLSSPTLMMIFSYAENKFTEIQAYAQKWLDAIGLASSEVYFTTASKTHHDINAVELTESEVMILEREVALIKPQFLLVTGRLAYEALFKERQSVTKSRMNRHAYQNVPTIVTYDPELVLQYPILRRDVWRDLQRLGELIKRETSKKEVSS